MPHEHDSHLFCNLLVFGTLFITCFVSVLPARYKRGRSSGQRLPGPPLHPGLYKELRSIFHQWEYPQTAEHDKPYHLVVTSLGLMSGLGWSDGWSDLDGLSTLFAFAFPTATHVIHPNNRQVNPKFM